MLNHSIVVDGLFVVTVHQSQARQSFRCHSGAQISFDKIQSTVCRGSLLAEVSGVVQTIRSKQGENVWVTGLVKKEPHSHRTKILKDRYSFFFLIRKSFSYIEQKRIKPNYEYDVLVYFYKFLT